MNNSSENINKCKILLVEDDELNVRMVASFLKGIYEIDNANSGEEAIKKVLDQNYNVILMDIGLKKEMSGLEVTKTIRKIPEYRNTPIIALTAYALSGDKERIINAGCSHYLSKPFTKHQLINLLHLVLNSNKTILL
ncbi:MAG: response regulator [Ignavibacteriaceae bacterium]